jgi:hypothetical protein
VTCSLAKPLLLILLASSAVQSPRPLPLNHLRAIPGPAPSSTDFHEMATAVGDDYFDGTSPLARVKRHFAVARRMGVKYLRCAFSWNAIEKHAGEYDWTFWDNLVALAESNGIQLLPYVAYTPEWAAKDAKDFWKQPPRDPALYAGFMYTIAARYRGRILSWEIWNEPDNKDFWTGTADEFAALAEAAARRIREADPQAVLVLGGMAYGPGEFFQRLMREDHIAGYVDVIAMHVYPESWLNQRAEDIFQQWVPAMRQMIQSVHSGAQLWLNEMGYPDYRLTSNQASVYGTRIFYNYEHTPAYQAAMLFKLEVMALASGQVELTGWYRIDDFPVTERRLGSDLINYHLGLEDSRHHPKPAFFALRFFNRLFHRATRLFPAKVAAPAGSQAVVNVFQTREGKVVVVGWLRSSHESEITDTSGMMQDRRVETVSTSLPCTASKLIGYYDVEGHHQKGEARLHAGSLENIRIADGKVFIAELACTKP